MAASTALPGTLRLLLGFTLISTVLSIIPVANHSATLEVPFENSILVVRFSPSTVEKLVEHETAIVSYRVEDGPTARPDGPRSVKLRVTSKHKHIASVEQPAEITVSLDANTTSPNASFVSIKGHFLGRTVLRFSVAETGSSYVSSPAGTAADPAGTPEPPGRDPQVGQGNSHPLNTTDVNSPYTQTVLHLPRSGGDNWTVLDFEYHVSVVREHRAIDNIFISVIVIIIVLANVGMGCKIDLEVIKEVTRRPIAPAIGMGCQYIIMPLMAFALIKLLQLEGGVALGMFATGCSPGGGASNMYTYLLKGDVSLSVTMTFFSTLAALGLIPFWLFTLGRVILTENASSQIRIPYANIIYSLLAILVPVGIGILIQRFKPSWAKKILMTLRPVFLFFIIFIFTFGVYVNLFIFKLFTPRLVVAGILLPYVGFFLGGLIAFFCRQSWERIKTIAVETGIQNTGVAYLVLTFTLPQPEADLSMVSPIIVATFTPIPLMIGIGIIEYRKRCSKDRTPEQDPQTPATEEATFDQIGQKPALNGHSEDLKQSDSTAFPLIDDSQSTTI